MKSNKTIDFIKELQVGDIIVKDGVFLKETEETGCFLKNLPILLKVLNKEIIVDKYGVLNNIKTFSWNEEFENQFTFVEYKKIEITIQAIRSDRNSAWIEPVVETFISWEENEELIDYWFKWVNISKNTLDLIVRPQEITNDLYY